MGRPLVNLVGKRFGKRTVVCWAYETTDHVQYWLCRCDCGLETLIRGSKLSAQNGCRPCQKRTHGESLTKTREWRTWISMRRRCSDSTLKGWKHYGGRGIAVCARWQDSYEAFLSDMGRCPEGRSLDRWPNNDGNYEPGNCRWATRSEQRRNRRDSHGK